MTITDELLANAERHATGFAVQTGRLHEVKT
jgi:hypothetical protein